MWRITCKGLVLYCMKKCCLNANAFFEVVMKVFISFEPDIMRSYSPIQKKE